MKNDAGRQAPGQPAERTGTLVVRVWLEGGDPATGLRARITRTVDVESSEQVVTTTTKEDAILSTVRTWLDSFTAG